MPRIYSGHPIPALRPEQSDHVPWADCPQGLSSTSVRFAHPPGKSPLLPIFERGSSQCRAQTSWQANSCYRARSCSLFSSFKKGKAFSLRCLSPLCSPAVGAGQTQPMRVGMLRRRLDGFAVSINRPVSQLTAGGRLTQPAQHVFFCNSKGQHGFETKLAFLASHEARRRMAVFPIQLTTNPHQTREPRGPSPSGGKTPAKPHVLRVPPRPMGAVRGAGRREEDARRVVHGTTRSAFGRLNFSNKI